MWAVGEWMNKGQNKKGSGTYHYIFDTVKGSFASFARLYRYFNDAVRYIIATFPTRWGVNF